MQSTSRHRTRALQGAARSTPAERFARWGGTLYAALGLVGFGVTGFGGFTRTVGAPLLLLEVNPLQNLLHLAVGIVLIFASAIGPGPARTATLLVASSVGVAGLLGFALTGTDGNVLAVNHAANVLHVLTATVATASVAATRTVGPSPA